VPRNDSIEAGELTDTVFYILLSLVEAKHGYLIMKSIENMTDGKFTVGPASMYTTIKKLLVAKLIELYSDEGENKKTYVATESGISLLKQEVDRRKEMIRHAENILNQKGGLEYERDKISFKQWISIL